MVETFGTRRSTRRSCPALVQEHFDLRPAAIIERLDLRRPIYQQTAAYGHFGRDERDFTWERTDAPPSSARPPRRWPDPLRRLDAACDSSASAEACVTRRERRAGRRVQPDVPAIHRAFDYLVPDALAATCGSAPSCGCRSHGRRVRGWVLDADVADARGRRVAPPRRRSRSCRRARRPTSSTLCRWAAWRWAGPTRRVPARRVAAQRRRHRASMPERRDRGVPGVARRRAPVARRRARRVAPADDRDAVRRRRCCRAGGIDAWCSIPTRCARRALVAHARATRAARSRVHRAPIAARPTLTAAWDRARAGRACRRRRPHRGVGAGAGPRAVIVVDEADEALEEERAPTWNARDVASNGRARAPARRSAWSRPRRRSTRRRARVALAWRRAATVAADAWPRVEVVDLRDEHPGQGC